MSGADVDTGNIVPSGVSHQPFSDVDFSFSYNCKYNGELLLTRRITYIYDPSSGMAVNEAILERGKLAEDDMVTSFDEALHGYKTCVDDDIEAKLRWIRLMAVLVSMSVAAFLAPTNNIRYGRMFHRIQVLFTVLADERVVSDACCQEIMDYLEGPWEALQNIDCKYAAGTSTSRGECTPDAGMDEPDDEDLTSAHDLSTAEGRAEMLKQYAAQYGYDFVQEESAGTASDVEATPSRSTC